MKELRRKEESKRDLRSTKGTDFDEVYPVLQKLARTSVHLGRPARLARGDVFAHYRVAELMEGRSLAPRLPA